MRAEVVLLLVPQQANVGLRCETGGRAASDDSAAPLEALHRDGPGIGPGMLEDDIGAPAIGDSADFLEDVGFFTMQYEVGAQLFAAFDLIVAAPHPHHAPVHKPPDLH